MFKEAGKRIQWIIVAAVVVLSVVVLFGYAAPRPSAVNSVSAQAVGSVDSGAGLFTLIYRDVSPSVVAINVAVTGRNGSVMVSGSGSGFVVDTDGHIVTNDHVVSGATSIEVEFFDGTLASADIVGLDPASDLAVLAVDVPAEVLMPVEFGDSSTLLVGETVLAIGSPYGQDWTLTTGIVSGLNRVIGGLTDFSIGGVIQTDAAINPGNSGGPLLNLDEQVVGVNSQILSESGSNSGVGFAIPSNLVRRVVQELIDDGTVDYSYMGISGTDVTLSLIQALNLPTNTRGVIVTETARSGPATQAGLQTAAISTRRNNSTASFDIVTAVDKMPIKGMNDLISFLARETLPGETVTLTVLRNGSQTLDIPVTLSSRP